MDSTICLGRSRPPSSTSLVKTLHGGRQTHAERGAVLPEQGEAWGVTIVDSIQRAPRPENCVEIPVETPGARACS
eukprot:8618602-Lingulodinium_polyedra.AAC.1